MVLTERARADRLAQILEEMQRHRFGRWAETLPLDQLELGLEDVQRVEADEAAQVEKADPDSRSKTAEGCGPTAARCRRTCPGSRPSLTARTRPAPSARGLNRIGEGRAERLDIVPAQLRVLVVRRHAYRSCENVVVQAPAPARVIEGGIPTEATSPTWWWASTRSPAALLPGPDLRSPGIKLDRSMLADWVGRASFLLRPVHERLLETLKRSEKLFAVGTTAPVLDPGRGPHQDRPALGLCARRPTLGGSDPPAVAYVYAPGRKAEQPMAHLQGFSSVLQVDGYGGYRVLAEKTGVRLAFRGAHVRRRFYELAAAGPALIGIEALDRIKALYAIEASKRSVIRPSGNGVARQVEPGRRLGHGPAPVGFSSVIGLAAA